MKKRLQEKVATLVETCLRLNKIRILFSYVFPMMILRLFIYNIMILLLLTCQLYSHKLTALIFFFFLILNVAIVLHRSTE